MTGAPPFFAYSTGTIQLWLSSTVPHWMPVRVS